MRVLAAFLCAMLTSCAGAQSVKTPKPKHEVTLSRGCWSPRYAEVYTFMWDDTSCSNPRAFVWAKKSMPIRYYIEKGVGREKEINEAAERWNVILGREVFRRSFGTTDLVIRDAVQGELLLSIYLGNVVRATTEIEREQDELFGEIVIHFMEKKGESVTMTMMHEFGHVLGLSHDDNDINSLMFPVFAPERKLTPADRKALTSIYGQ